MTKELFRKLVLGGMESLMALPDDLFEQTYPSIRLAMRNRISGEVQVVFVGIEPDADDDELDIVSQTDSIPI
jgi:hypothetical protein